MPEVVYYHQTLPAHPMRRNFDGMGEGAALARQFALAVGSVAHRYPAGRVRLITGDDPPLLAGIAVERRPLDDPAILALDRIRAYRAFVSDRVGRDGGAVFLDTDTLVLNDLGPIFGEACDIAVTYLERSVTPPPTMLDEWGLPTDRRPSAINGGVMAVRYTAAAVAFFDAILARYAAIVSAGRSFLTGRRNVFPAADMQSAFRISDVRTWGGGQFATTSLLSDALFHGGAPASAVVAGAEVGLLPARVWNFTPSEGRSAPGDFAGVRIAHFKGPAKHMMEACAQRLGIVAALPAAAGGRVDPSSPRQ